MKREALLFVPAGLLVLVAAWSLWAQRAEMAAVPSADEWSAARQVVRDGFAEGDIIRTAPHWADQGRVGMFEYPFNTAQELEEEELYRSDRLWLIGTATHVEDALAELPEGWQLEQHWQDWARTAVALVDIPPPDHVLLDVVEDIATAVVTRDYGDRVETCELFHNGGWQCGQVDPYLHVTPSDQEVGNSLRRCLYAGVPPATLRITWPATELGARIAGNFGNTMPSIRADRGSDVDFAVEIDGQSVHSLRLGRWDQSFVPFDIDTSAFPGTHDLSLVIRADDFYDRWVCLRGRVLR